MFKLPVPSLIGNAAAVLCGGRGSVSQRAREAGCSRQTVYQHAARIEQAVEQIHQGGPTPEELQQENTQLREENQQLRQALEEATLLPVEKQQEFTATASAMGVSLTQIFQLLAILLPASQCPSRSKLGRWVADAADRAGQVLQVLDAACRPLLVALALDEIFLGRKPVLVGVEPASMAWVLGQKADDRSGQTWQGALEPFDLLEYVLADAGSGLQKGLALLGEARQNIPGAPALEVNLDVFHTKKEAAPVLRRLWQRVEKLWEAAERRDTELAECRRQGKNASGAASRARAAWNKAERAFEEAERIEATWHRAEAALDLFRPDGQLNDRTWAEAEIKAAVAELQGPEWAKVCRLLQHPHALTFLDRTHRLLVEAEPDEMLREALVRLWWLRRQRSSESREEGPGTIHARCAVQSVLCQQIDPNWGESYGRVARVLRGVVRASSVVEGMNSIIRMHQARHRTLTQALLNLKRLWWNCRAFCAGKRRGRCPYEHLGLRLASYRFWDLLRRDPAELAQELSIKELTT